MNMYTHKLLRCFQMFLLSSMLYVMISQSFANIFVLILLTLAWLISDGELKINFHVFSLYLLEACH